MEITGSRTFVAGPQAVWDALHNSAVLKQCAPGADTIEWQGDNAIFVSGTVNAGPFNRSLAGTAQVVESTAPSHMKIVVNRGGVNATATIDLAQQGTGTQLNYNAQADLGGPLAMVAPFAKGFIEGQLNQFFTKFEQQLG